MKVLYLVDTYPTYQDTNPNIFVHNQVKGIKKKGIDVAVFLIDLRSIKNKRKWGFSKFEYEGITVFRFALPIGPINFLLRRLYKKIAIWGIKRISKEWGTPNLVHAHFYMMGICAYKIRESFSIPYVITEHSSKVLKDELTNDERKDLKKAYDYAEHVWAVGKALKEKMLNTTSRDVTLLYNIVPFRFRYMQGMEKYDKFTFICVGNLCKVKRVDIVIEAMHELRKKMSDVQLLVIGKGEEEDNLKRKVSEYGMQDTILFKGAIDNKELPELYNKCHCFVLASDFETFGVVWREALACGIPVIGTTCGGPEEIIHENNGRLIPKNDVKSMIKAMEWMYFNANTFLPEQLSKEIEEKCGEEIIVQELFQQYQIFNGN